MSAAKKEPNQQIKKEPLTSLKGMRDIIGDDYYKFQGFYEKAQEVAVYYGFTPIAIPILEKEEVFTSSIGAGTDIIDKEMYSFRTKGGEHIAMRPEGTAGVVRAYLENGMQSLPQPVMLYYYGPFFRHDKPQKGRYRQLHQFGLECIGSEKSINDAIIIKTTVAILEEAGAKNLIVDINSMGDKDSRLHYIKELTNYYRKHLADLPADARERLKVNPLRLLDSKDPKMIEVNQSAPDSVSFLSSESKRHFKEVLEYLDEMGIPYRINKCLVRGLSYYNKTVFEVMEADPNEEGKEYSIAGGGRYDYLARFLGSKKDVPAMGAAIGVDRVVEAPWHSGLPPRIMKKPKVCFIQLGVEAKLKSLNVIEILRKARIPIYHTLAKDSLSAQLATAEKIGCPHAIIFGQKEALEQSVIVRAMKNRSQETVKITDLAHYLKEL